jgi:hypothetical protein
MPPKRTAAQILEELRNIDEEISGDDDSDAGGDDLGISNESDENLNLENHSSDSETDDHLELVIDEVINLVKNDADEIKYQSKSGVVWSKLNNTGYCKCRNRVVYTQLSGVTNFAKKNINQSALSAFNCIFDNKMIRNITIFTN